MHVARAGRPPNFNNSSFDFDSLDIDEESIELVNESLPVLFGLLAFGFLYPLFAIPLPAALLVGVGAVLGLSFSSGFLSKVERKLGISTTQSALAIVGVVFAIFAVPAVLRFGFFLLALGAAANLVTMLVNPGGGGAPSNRTPGGMGGMGGFGDMSSPYTPPRTNNSSRNSNSGSSGRGRSDGGKTIDVEWETIDD